MAKVIQNYNFLVNNVLFIRELRSKMKQRIYREFRGKTVVTNNYEYKGQTAPKLCQKGIIKSYKRK